MTITISIRSVYGRESLYPVCETAQRFCALLNTKTLTREALKHIQALGYSIQVQTPTL